MDIIKKLRNLRKKYPKPVVTIGIFDGLHRGHQRIIDKVVVRAKRIEGTSFVITFHPHPLEVLHPEKSPRLITSLEQRTAFMSKLGIDVVLLLRFSKNFAKLSPEAFVKDILVDRIGAHCVIVGEDFLFGHRHRGNINLLKELGAKFGFETFVVGDIKIDNVAVSSTLVRERIMKGDIEFASKILGRPFSIQGAVVKGKSLGRLINYPTANIDCQHLAIPPDGVYAVKVDINGVYRCGILNIGRRPTFGTFNNSVAEVHIIDFNQRIYGKTIEAIFLKRLRDEKRFPTREQLTQQINKDEQIARTLYLASRIP